MKCIRIDDLDYSVTPDDLQRMNLIDVEEEVKGSGVIYVTRRLIEMATPKEPERFIDGYVERFKCSVCGGLLLKGWKTDGWSYCPKCGQAVKLDA